MIIALKDKSSFDQTSITLFNFLNNFKHRRIPGSSFSCRMKYKQPVSPSFPTDSWQPKTSISDEKVGEQQ